MSVAEMTADEKRVKTSQAWLANVDAIRRAAEWISDNSERIPDCVNIGCSPHGSVEVRLGYLFASSEKTKAAMALFVGMQAKQITKANGDRDYIVVDLSRELTFSWTVWADKTAEAPQSETIIL